MAKLTNWFLGQAKLKASAVIGLALGFAAVSAPVASAAVQENQNDAAETELSLEAFIETEMLAKMEELNVAGATMALVRDGEVIYAKGFGQADMEKDRPVKADDTLFRWGSISKIFTWTAIMQLVEQGKVSLDADVNDYLVDIRIPEAFGGPVRVKDLMAHTPGFEDEGLGHLFESDPANVLPLKEYLLKYQPKRVRPAGVAFAYSNYGSALAGHIVANVSGMPFEDYMEANVFGPLGMQDTTFREPMYEHRNDGMPPEMVDRLSKGFVVEEGGPSQVEKFTYIGGVGPAGAVTSTATDMAKFATMHLSGCALGEVRILQPKTCATMHSVLRPLNASGEANNLHGFFQFRRIGGHNRVGHNGGTIRFFSEMGLYPDYDFAFLMSVNTTTGPQLNKHMEEAIVTRLFGDNTTTPDPIEPPAGFIDRAHKYTGHYQMTRRNYSSIEVLYSLFQGSAKVTVDEDAYLVLHLGGEETRLAEVRRNLFRAVKKDEYYEFVENAAGEVIYLKALASFDKVSWYQAPENRLLLIGTTFLFLLIGLIAISVRSLKRFAQQDDMIVKQARRRILLSLGLWLAFLVLFVTSILLLVSSGQILSDFPSPLTVIALSIGLLAVIVALVPTVSTVTLWRQGAWGRGWRIYYTLVVLAIWMFALQLNAIHLIGFNYTT